MKLFWRLQNELMLLKLLEREWEQVDEGGSEGVGIIVAPGKKGIEVWTLMTRGSGRQDSLLICSA